MFAPYAHHTETTFHYDWMYVEKLLLASIGFSFMVGIGNSLPNVITIRIITNVLMHSFLFVCIFSGCRN